MSEFAEILTKLRSKETRKETNKKLILESIKENFNLELPLSDERNYPFEKLNKVYNSLIDMLAEVLSES
jgi:hypothetical protein